MRTKQNKSSLNCKKIASKKENKEVIPKLVSKTSQKSPKKILSEMCNFYESYPRKDRRYIYPYLTSKEYNDKYRSENGFMDVVQFMFKNKDEKQLNNMAQSFKKKHSDDIETQNDLFEISMDKFDLNQRKK